MIKIFSTAALSSLLICVGIRVAAQSQEISLSTAGGFSGLRYTMQNGTATLKPGFQAGVGYTRFFNRSWGISTGLGLGHYQTKAKLDPNTVYSSYQVDNEGSAFEYRVKAKGYEETQHLYAVNLPMLLQYQSLPAHKTQLYTLAGVKLSLPLSSHFSSSADEISAAGYYPDVNVEMTDLPAHGFGTQTNWKKEGDYSFNLALGLSAETGVKFWLSPRGYLYAGAYMDYGLNDLKKEQGSAALLSYNPATLSGSQATGVLSLSTTTGSVHLLSYGIRLRLAFSLGKPAKAVVHPVVENNRPVQLQAPVQAEEKQPSETVVDSGIKIEHKEPEKATPHPLTPAEEAVLETPIRFNKVGDTTLSAASKAQADSLAVIMQQYPSMNLLIEGHTCDLGSDAVNSRVGLARAGAVVLYLQQKGIDGSRMQAVSKGADEPIVPNTSETNRKLNRRVVIKVSDL
jgi:outer membrane protein OmpA-like peptidoglycan-associated protein